MNSVHLVIPGLFLPPAIAADVCRDLALPALENLLAHGGETAVAAAALEKLLGASFGLPDSANVPVAPLAALFDGLGRGCWLRVDPVNMQLARSQMLLQPDVAVNADEARQFCASLNQHFAEQGLEFFAPHPQRWYLRLERLPEIETVPLSQTAGRDMRGLLPKGNDAVRWHQLSNEIQMLLFAHPVNAEREARGELSVNSVWLWGGGCSDQLSLQKTYDCASADETLTQIFAAAAGVRFSPWREQWQVESCGGRQLLVWNGLLHALQQGDLAAWRAALQRFERGYAQPLWCALRNGGISRVQLDILTAGGSRRFALGRADAWKFWRRHKHLENYSVV